MDSNSHYQLQQNSGLLRFRSAPSSILSNLAQGSSGNSSAINNKGNHSTAPNWDGSSSSCSSEPDRLVLRFLNSNDNSSNNDSASPSLREFQDKPSENNNNKECSAPSLSLMNSHHHHHHQQGYVPSRFMRQSSNNSNAGSTMDCSFGLMGSVGMDLQRQSSFPAAEHFSSNISFQNGYDTMKGVGNYNGVNSSDSELSLSMNRVNNQISFTSSSRAPSSLGIQSKMGSDHGGTTNNNSNNGFHYGSWNNNETLDLSEKLSSGGSKRDRSSSNDKLFSDAHDDGELGVSHQLSFSKAASDIFAMENMIQFPADSVPCKIRAKRGCATHPRSIAERVRRTRISERIRKLQELVPNMDKQTSTAEMLDLAVVYIKDLQKQFKKLSDKRAKCKCMQNSDS